MATVKTKKKTKAPSPAQLRARRRFAAAAKARAKAALAAKQAAGLKAPKKRMTPARKAKVPSAKAMRRRNLDHRDAKHPIHVTDYWQGRRGYKTQWQRAHEGGQKQLFQVKNPAAFSAKLVRGSQIWKSLSSDKRQVIISTLRALNKNSWRQDSSAKAIGRLGGLTKSQASDVAAFCKVGFTVPLDVIKAAQKAGDPGIIDRYRSDGKRANGAGTSLARKRRAEFVGRPSRKVVNSYAPKGSGAKGTLVAMGKLKKLKIKGRPAIDFKGVPMLAHDPKTDRMFVLGKGYSMKLFKKRNPEGIEDLGEVTHIEYEAVKTQLGDTEPVVYVHELGEEGGERPHALVNEENLLILEGGEYYITPEGIRD